MSCLWQMGQVGRRIIVDNAFGRESVRCNVLPRRARRVAGPPEL